jgi:aspartate carbamoyltransferase catalytic subunit
MSRLGQRPPDWAGQHLLDVTDLSAGAIELILERAEVARERVSTGSLPLDDLRGRRLALLFVEPSTRTRLSFEIAARNLSGDVVHVDVPTSSMVKGESIPDTVRTLHALGVETIVMRHPRSGAPWLAANYFPGHMLNAGDGWHAHPSQALLDLFTLRRAFGEHGLRGRKVAVVGDILHSRVCRSNLWTLTGAGAEVWLCGPRALLQGFEAWAKAMPADRRFNVTDDLDAALRDADAVMALRIQRERMDEALAGSLGEYVSRYRISEERLGLARPAAPVLHPGPVNEGIEVTGELAAGPRSLVLEQVRNGVPVRMAILSLVAGRE